MEVLCEYHQVLCEYHRVFSSATLSTGVADVAVVSEKSGVETEMAEGTQLFASSQSPTSFGFGCRELQQLS
jgi:hypothetical protein